MLAADEIIRRVDRMISNRSNWDRLWQDCGRFVLPRQNTFTTNQQGSSQAQDRDQVIYDSTAPQALEKFGAAMESMLTPRTQRWHGLLLSDPDLSKSIPVRRWLDSVTDIMFKVRYASSANFASQASEYYLSLGAFGSGCIFVEDALSRGIQYQNIHLSELAVATDAWNRVVYIARSYQYTVRQALEKFGDKCPQQIKDKADSKPDDKFDFVHYVCPNDKREAHRVDISGMGYHAYDVCKTTKDMIAIGGYRTLPYAFGRYNTAPNEDYGRGPAMTVLADIKTLNEMSKTSLRYGQLITDPPWLVPDGDALQAFSTRSGAIVYGGLDEQGNELVKALSPATRGNPNFTLELMNQRRESINRAFLVTLFQVLVDSPQMTATEVMQRMQEKGSLLAPAMGRQQSEFLGVIIERELDILWHAGVLPDPPPELADSGASVLPLYDSPLTRLQRADEGIGILKTFEQAGSLAQFNPRVIDRLDSDAALQLLAAINGMPSSILRTDEEVKALGEQAAQAEQTQNLLSAAPVAASSAKDMAQAAATGQQVAV